MIAIELDLFLKLTVVIMPKPNQYISSVARTLIRKSNLSKYKVATHRKCKDSSYLWFAESNILAIVLNIQTVCQEIQGLWALLAQDGTQDSELSILVSDQL